MIRFNTKLLTAEGNYNPIPSREKVKLSKKLHFPEQIFYFMLFLNKTWKRTLISAKECCKGLKRKSDALVISSSSSIALILRCALHANQLKSSFIFIKLALKRPHSLLKRMQSSSYWPLLLLQALSMHFIETGFAWNSGLAFYKHFFLLN